MKNKKIRFKIKWKNIIILLFIIICLFIIFSSLPNIKLWSKENRKTNKQLELINETITIKDKKDNKNTIIIDTNINKSKNDSYKLIDVNISKLKKINSNTIGWIKINGTSINYPFLQTTNNTYYLDHTFDKTYNKAGWIFLDYRNNIKHINKNTILYFPSETNQIMFEPLKNTLDKKWLNNSNNHLIKLSTEYENTLWKIVSIYHIKNTNDYLKISFNTNDEFINYSEMILNRSLYNFKTPISINDKLLTISTYYNKDEKLVLHAKLIKYEIK